MEIIGRLATSVIHDLNNLLTLVQLNAALLEQGGLPEEEVVEIAGKIGQACTRSSDLTRKVLDLARRRESVQKPFDVGLVVQKHTDLVKTFVANRADLTLAIHGEHLWAVGDPAEIEQAILNLILNAADAMHSRGQIRVECREVGDASGSIEIVVSDDGTGIPEEIREKIFEPLFTTKADGVGTGMGLFTVRRVVERHAGTVEVTSEEGAGSRFVIRLPRVAGRTDALAPKAAAAPRPMAGRLLLLVEDDPGISELTRKILVGGGMRVIVAADGDSAMELWGKHRDEIDLLLTDLVLPGDLSGRDIAIRALADRPELPVIYTSGFSDSGDEHPYLTAQNFLRKPFNPTALKGMVESALT